MVDHIGPRTLPQLLADRIERDPGKPALVFEDRSGQIREYTYAEVGDVSARAAAGFARLGIGLGDKVVIHLPNCPEFVFTFFALAHLGAVGVPSNTANRANEMKHVIRWSDARLVVTSHAFLELFDEILPHVPNVERVIVTRGEVRKPHFAFSELLAREPAAGVNCKSEAPIEIIFTSGTTSLPKGVVLTHANWLWAGERASHWLRIDDHDRLLTALPLFHVNAQSFTLMAALTVGATAIFLEDYSAGRFIHQVRRHGATQISLVAMLLRTLLAQPESPDDSKHAVRRVPYAINVSASEKDAFEQRFGVELLNGYGLSEAMTDVSVCPVYGEKRWPSIGQVSFGREVRLVDGQGNEVRPGEVGEITVRGVPGRTIMKEYYKDPTATARTIVDGWLHTGDNGYFDEHGYLYFFDRAKDVIKRAGESISASEVEVALTEHPLVSLAAVIGVPDPIRDEAVMAFIVPEPGAELTVDELLRHCSDRLARFKVPTSIEFRDALPMTSIGKVEKRRLRSMINVTKTAPTS
jgi:crotonobetaine/carnitine-CoA ligase